MPVSLDELRQVLVEQWCVVSLARWELLKKRFAEEPTRIVRYLARKARFPRNTDPIPFLTPTQVACLNSGRSNELLSDVAGKPYLRLQHLGRGGQGVVWIACPRDSQASTESLVALKTPRASISDREIAILEQLPPCVNIVRLVAADRTTGAIATRLVHGASLEEELKGRRPFTVARTVGIGIDVCRALEVLHFAGFIHKDVKPGNIVLENGTEAVLIDFGFAENPTLAARRLIEGTPYYIAPELFDPALAPDVTADIYSLAATLYRLLTDEPPHFQQCIHPNRDRSTRAKLDMWQFQLAGSALDCDLTESRPDVPRILATVLSKALDAEPSARQKSAAELRGELQKIQSDLDAACKIEREVWAFEADLLKKLRELFHDDAMVGREWENATELQTALIRLPTQYKALQELRTPERVAEWSEYERISPLISRTVKTIANIEAHAQQLEAFLKKHPRALHRQPQSNQTELLKELLTRTLEGIRTTCVLALAVAHSWHSALLQLGVHRAK